MALYNIGTKDFPCYTGDVGLEEFDRVMKEKAKEYWKDSQGYADYMMKEQALPGSNLRKHWDPEKEYYDPIECTWRKVYKYDKTKDMEDKEEGDYMRFPIEENKKPSALSIEKAAQAWCTPKTSSIEMDTDLAYAFAEILDEIWSKPWLGNATTKELLDEISARVDLTYKTTKDEK